MHDKKSKIIEQLNNFLTWVGIFMTKKTENSNTLIFPQDNDWVIF